MNLTISTLDSSDGDPYYLGTPIRRNEYGVPMDPCPGDSGQNSKNVNFLMTFIKQVAL